jgi:GDPmannose 4,6-dehydratase
VENLWGDSSKARKILKWKPKYSLDSLVKEMINLDIDEAYKEFRIKHLDAKE